MFNMYYSWNLHMGPWKFQLTFYNIYLSLSELFHIGALYNLGISSYLISLHNLFLFLKLFHLGWNHSKACTIFWITVTSIELTSSQFSSWQEFLPHLDLDLNQPLLTPRGLKTSGFFLFLPPPLPPVFQSVCSLPL